MLKECYASFDAASGRLTLGNSRIEKTMIIKGSFIRTEKVEDKSSSVKWNGGKPLWQRCPVLGVQESPEIRFEAVECDAPLAMKPHLKVSLELAGNSGTAWYEYIIFPNIPFIYSQISIEKKGELELGLSQSDFKQSTGVETGADKVSQNDIICDSNTLDCIPLRFSHLEVESFNLYDKTDNNDMLVERSTFPLYKRGVTEREGNIFKINDYATENTLMIIKHSPTHSSELNRSGKDIVFPNAAYALLRGTGVDFNDIPEGKVPYYASAIGVSKTADISDEYWRYSTAFSTGDDRGALFIMSNTWGDRSQDMAISEEFIMKELDRAKELGVDILQIDDGWMSGITANSLRKKGGAWGNYYAYDSNFWDVDPERFPNDLYPVINKAKEYGIEIGLWFGPDSSNDFANVEKDIEILMDLYKKYGVRYFKFDGVGISSKKGEMGFIYMMKKLTELTNGDMRFNLDVTAGDRFGYLYHTQYGTLFVENRYTDWGNYFPHNTFKNLWHLASIVPTRRLQMELLNNKRNIDKYFDLKYAPSQYGMDYIFAVTMPANPLVWMEMTHLEDADVKVLSRITDAYKPYKAELFNSQVIPIGDAPSGKSFSGYLCRSEDKKSGHIILFRETTEADTYTFKLPLDISDAEIEVIYDSASAEISKTSDGVTVKFSEPRSFVWAKVK